MLFASPEQIEFARLSDHTQSDVCTMAYPPELNAAQLEQVPFETPLSEGVVKLISALGQAVQ